MENYGPLNSPTVSFLSRLIKIKFKIIPETCLSDFRKVLAIINSASRQEDKISAILPMEYSYRNLFIPWKRHFQKLRNALTLRWNKEDRHQEVT
jgi:hypothetical protein